MTLSRFCKKADFRLKSCPLMMFSIGALNRTAQLGHVTEATCWVAISLLTFLIYRWHNIGNNQGSLYYLSPGKKSKKNKPLPLV
jgi:hypothetical protein